MFRLLSLSAAALAAPAAAQITYDLPQVAPDWRSGDTHVHSQFCVGGTVFPDFTTEQVLFLQESFELDFVFNQVWNPTQDEAGLAKFMSYYAPMVDGTAIECPNEPDRKMLYGVEVSGFNCSQFGHLQGLNLNDGFFPAESFYTEPILDFFNAQPGAVSGYAHINWPGKFENYNAFPDFEYAHLPYMAPVDVALGKVAFLEVLGATKGGWKTLYYRLLNAGFRVGLSGASDNCGWLIGFGRTYSHMSETGDAGEWVDALADGRTTISLGITTTARFLDVHVDGQKPGSQIFLAHPQPIQIDARLYTTAGEDHASDGTFEVLFNGHVVDTKNFELPHGGSATLSTSYMPTRSGWFAVRTAETHSAPVYVYVDDAPIAEPKDTAYWVTYLERFLENVDNFELGEQQDDAVDYLERSLAVFEAHEAVHEDLPFGVLHYGQSTPSENGPVHIGVNAAPTIGNPNFRVTCVGAPPAAKGFLVISQTPDLIGNELNNATIYLDPHAPYLAAQLWADEGGFASVQLPTPMEMAGQQLWLQYVWVDTEDESILSASQALLVNFTL